ncbi:hypothetical protein FA002_00405 [Priestia megaterium]|uniref:hypothetical protein n=1 Tax=Priestia megaterium TaxID=1404 RepID=UPI0010AD0495|nr:hypothetical protein [Priestia megaterium]TJZ40066.1 hypothetical protein FA002_00405 [Priestia megaterium]
MIKRNQDLRTAIKKTGIYNWQIAEYLKVHENTFLRLLRKNLSENERKEIFTIIELLSERNRGK